MYTAYVIETLPFLLLSERNVSLVAIYAVIYLIMQGSAAKRQFAPTQDAPAKGGYVVFFLCSSNHKVMNL